MASYGEKAQKLTGEAFARICSDHELFLEAYESKWKIPERVPSELGGHRVSERRSFPSSHPSSGGPGMVTHGSSRGVSAGNGRLGRESGGIVGEGKESAAVGLKELLARCCCCCASRRGQLYMFSRVR